MKSQTEAAMLTDDDWEQSEICQLDHLSSINSSWYKELELRKVLPFAKWTRQLETGACPVAGNFEVDCSENILGVAKISMGCVLAWLKSKSHRHFPNIYVSSPLIAQFEWTAFDAPKYRGLIAVGGKNPYICMCSNIDHTMQSNQSNQKKDLTDMATSIAVLLNLKIVASYCWTTN